MFYPLILVCSMSTQQCTLIEDTTDFPYATREECVERVQEMNSAVPSTLLPSLRSQGDFGPFEGRLGCFEEDRVRELFPDAYDLGPAEEEEEA